MKKSAWHHQRVVASAAFYREIIKNDPTNVDALMSLGCMMYEETKFDEAYTCLKAAVSTKQVPSRKMASIMRIKGSSAYELWKAKTANWDLIYEEESYKHLLVEAYEDLSGSLMSVTNLSVPELLLEVACVYCDYGAMEGAVETMGRILLNFPNFRNPEVMLKTALMFFRMKQYAMCRKYLVHLMDYPPPGFTDDQIIFISARCGELEGDGELARAGYTDVYRIRLKRGGYDAVYKLKNVEKWFFLPAIFNEMGDLFYSMREFCIAGDLYAEAIRRGLKDFNDYWTAAIALHFGGDKERAANMMEMCYNFDHHDLKIRKLLYVWHEKWKVKIDNEDHCASKIQGLYKMRKARRERYLLQAMAYRLTRWMRRRLKARRRYVYTKTASHMLKTVYEEVVTIRTNERLAHRFFSSLQNRLVWKVFKCWDVWRTRNIKVRKMAAKTLRSLTAEVFEAWIEGVNMIKDEKTTKVKSTIAQLQQGCAYRCMKAWSLLAKQIKVVRHIMLNNFKAYERLGMESWREFVRVSRQREYLVKKDKERRLAAEQLYNQARKALADAILGGDKATIRKAKKAYKKAKEEYEYHDDSDEDEYDDEWAHSFHHLTRAERDHIKRTRAANKIQKWWRGYWDKRHIRFIVQTSKNLAKTRSDAAVKIQALWRGWYCRKQLWLQKASVAALKLQCLYRGLRARRRVAKMRRDIKMFWNTIVLEEFGIKVGPNVELSRKMVGQLDKLFPLTQKYIGHLHAYAPTPRSWTFLAFNTKASAPQESKGHKAHSKHVIHKKKLLPDPLENHVITNMSKGFIGASTICGMYMLPAQSGKTLMGPPSEESILKRKLKGSQDTGGSPPPKRNKKNKDHSQSTSMKRKKTKEGDDGTSYLNLNAMTNSFLQDMDSTDYSNIHGVPRNGMGSRQGKGFDLEPISEGKQFTGSVGRPFSPMKPERMEEFKSSIDPSYINSHSNAPAEEPVRASSPNRRASSASENKRVQFPPDMVEKTPPVSRPNTGKDTSSRPNTAAKDSSSLFPESNKDVRREKPSPPTSSNNVGQTPLPAPMTPNKALATKYGQYLLQGDTISRPTSTSSAFDLRPSSRFSIASDISGTSYEALGHYAAMLPGAMVKSFAVPAVEYTSTPDESGYEETHDLSIYGKPHVTKVKSKTALEMLAMTTRDKGLVESLAKIELKAFKSVHKRKVKGVGAVAIRL
jgi:tetratricopeptide (TPR) repeat protein